MLSRYPGGPMLEARTTYGWAQWSAREARERRRSVDDAYTSDCTDNASRQITTDAPPQHFHSGITNDNSASCDRRNTSWEFDSVWSGRYS